MEKENGGSGIIVGLLMGGIIGAVLGLLLAPKPGREMRERLRNKLDEVRSRGKSALEKEKEAAEELRGL